MPTDSRYMDQYLRSAQEILRRKAENIQAMQRQLEEMGKVLMDSSEEIEHQKRVEEQESRQSQLRMGSVSDDLLEGLSDNGY